MGSTSVSSDKFFLLWVLIYTKNVQSSAFLIKIPSCFSILSFTFLNQNLNQKDLTISFLFFFSLPIPALRKEKRRRTPYLLHLPHLMGRPWMTSSTMILRLWTGPVACDRLAMKRRRKLVLNKELRKKQLNSISLSRMLESNWKRRELPSWGQLNLNVFWPSFKLRWPRIRMSVFRFLRENQKILVLLPRMILGPWWQTLWSQL